MAGDWIKLEHATLDKPEVFRTAEMLGVDRDTAIGIFCRYFVWLDQNLCPVSVRQMSGSNPDKERSTLTHMSAKGLDEVLHRPGFAACLVAIGWAEFDEKAWTMRVINSDRHNGKTAKSRALDRKLKAKQRREARAQNRPASVRQMSGSEPDKNRTREEKRSNYLKAHPLPLTESERNGATDQHGGVSDLEKESGENPSGKSRTAKPPAPPEGNGAARSGPIGAEEMQAATRVIECLSQNAGRRYEPVAANLAPVLARMREGYTERELRAICSVKARQWKDDARMNRYLRPATLFEATKCAQYRAELPRNQISES
jgi:uncharacterized phage protein (TIGR02220 family)